MLAGPCARELDLHDDRAVRRRDLNLISVDSGRLCVVRVQRAVAVLPSGTNRGTLREVLRTLTAELEDAALATAESTRPPPRST